MDSQPAAEPCIRRVVLIYDGRISTVWTRGRRTTSSGDRRLLFSGKNGNRRPHISVRQMLCRWHRCEISIPRRCGNLIVQVRTSFKMLRQPPTIPRIARAKVSCRRAAALDRWRQIRVRKRPRKSQSCASRTPLDPWALIARNAHGDRPFNGVVELLRVVG